MALLTCPDCQKEISDQTSHCIHCGCPLKAGQQQTAPEQQTASTFKSKLVEGVGGIIIIGLVLYFALGLDLATIGTWLRMSAPGCSDGDVKKTAVEIVKTQVLPEFLSAEMLSKTNFSLNLVRTVSVDKDAGSCSCAANLVMSDPQGLRLETPITYTSQLGDKRGEFTSSVACG